MTGAWAGSPALDRHYRRLLLAYPRAYRHRHGDEILTTLMEAAEPGRERPRAVEVRDLVGAGLRQRLRLPVGRWMAVAAAVTAITAGAAGTALGSAAGWATATGLPDDAGVRAIAGTVAGTPATNPEVSRDTGPLGLGSGATSDPIDRITGWSAGAAVARLTAARWRVDPVDTDRAQASYYIARDGAPLEPVPADFTRLVAERDGRYLQAFVSTPRGGPADVRDRSHVSIHVRAVEPAAALPLTVVGGVLGLLAGWLLAARVGYRLRRLSMPRRLPALAAAAATAAILAPLTVSTYRLVVFAIGQAAGPGPTGPSRFDIMPAYYPYFFNVTYGWNAVAGLAAAALTVALALAVRPAPPPDPVTG